MKDDELNLGGGGIEHKDFMDAVELAQAHIDESYVLDEMDIIDVCQALIAAARALGPEAFMTSSERKLARAAAKKHDRTMYEAALKAAGGIENVTIKDI